MARIVFLSGVWNFLLGALLLFPAVPRWLGADIPHPFWGWLLCAFLWFTTAVLVLASRRLRERASLVYWEGVLRLAAGALLLTLGGGVVGWIALPIGAADLFWGVVYLVGLPLEVERSPLQLLADR